MRVLAFRNYLIRRWRERRGGCMERAKTLVPCLVALAATLAIGGPAMAGGYSGRSGWKENVLSLRPWPNPGQGTSQAMDRQIRWAGPGATSSNAVQATPSDAVQATPSDAVRATPSGTVRMIPSDGAQVARAGAGLATPSDTRRAGPSDMGLATRSDAGWAGGEDGADGV